MSSHRPIDLFKRNSKNPIITAKDLPYPAHSVFNPGATKINGEVLLLMRVEDYDGVSHLTSARSKNGISDWRIDKRATIFPSPNSHPEEIWGIEDPRITRLEEKNTWAILYTSYSESGPLVSIATSSDFQNFKRLGAVLPPENKDAALFPIRFNNRWTMLHRPVAATPGIGSHIWISFSPDLMHWGEHKILIPANKGAYWDAGKIGLSAPPMETDEGWLILYHGVKSTVNGCIYRLGFALLDLEKPWQVIARSNSWTFSPEKDYETLGDVDKVVFPCGWIKDGDIITIYYGGADTCIAAASAEIPKILAWLKNDKK